CAVEVRREVRYFKLVNSTLIRERLNRDSKPFVLRLTHGTPVRVADPDFAAVSPGPVIVIDEATEAQTHIDPLHVVGIEELPKKHKTNGKHSRYIL
ncbi:MAG TPA: hypothetical protein VGV18_10465, partial [Verrucomicrobiae bacterium]|nr:hypothetical protein [Verrucomicrobiae bacterium]